MVAAESRFEIPEVEELALVSQRKYNLDEGRPWWETLYFRFVWLPVVRFGFNKMHIAGPAAYEPCGECAGCAQKVACLRPVIVLIEQKALYSEPRDAERLCAQNNAFWSWKPLPLDAELPDQSTQYKGHRLPGALLPDRYRRPSFPLIAKPLSEISAEGKGVAEAIAKVDSIRENLKTVGCL